MFNLSNIPLAHNSPVVDALERQKKEALQNLKEHPDNKFFQEEFSKAADALRNALEKQHDADIQQAEQHSKQSHELQMRDAEYRHQQNAMCIQADLQICATNQYRQMGYEALLFNSINHQASLNTPVASDSFHAAQQPAINYPQNQFLGVASAVSSY